MSDQTFNTGSVFVFHDGGKYIVLRAPEGETAISLPLKEALSLENILRNIRIKDENKYFPNSSTLEEIRDGEARAENPVVRALKGIHKTLQEHLADDHGDSHLSHLYAIEKWTRENLDGLGNLYAIEKWTRENLDGLGKQRAEIVELKKFVQSIWLKIEKMTAEKPNVYMNPERLAELGFKPQMLTISHVDGKKVRVKRRKK